MNAVIPFAFGDNLIRTLVLNDSPWFVIADVCRALGLTNPSVAIRPIDLDDLSTTEVIDSLGRTQGMKIANESGLYELIFQSRKEGAKAFRRWVTKEVIPSIRKTGSYTAPGAAPALTSPSERVLELIRAGVSPEGAERLVLADASFRGGATAALEEEVSLARMMVRMSNPMERAEALHALVEDGNTISSLIETLGCHPSMVYHLLSLIRLIPAAKEAVRARTITLRTGNKLIRFSDKQQETLLKEIQDKRLTQRQSFALLREAELKRDHKQAAKARKKRP